MIYFKLYMCVIYNILYLYILSNDKTSLNVFDYLYP